MSLLRKQTFVVNAMLVLATSFIAFIFLAVAVSSAFNLPGATKKRATEQAWAYAKENGYRVNRLSCVHDGDGDGYASCVMHPEGEERIFLQCSVDFFAVLLGGDGCKEIESIFKLDEGLRS